MEMNSGAAETMPAELEKPGWLAGKRAVVSGGAQGMGRAIVLLFAAQGARLVFSDIDGNAGRLTCGEAQAWDPDCLFVRADMGHAEDVATFARTALNRLGHVDILVNVVGINRRQRAEELDMDVFNHLLDVNLKSVVRLSKAFIPGMAAAGGGSIVNISSIHAQRSMTGFAAYAATKGGMESLTRVMAIDCAPQNIRINTVSPGAIYTSEMRPWWEGRMEEPVDYPSLLAHQPVTGPGLATDIAHTVLFLASDRSGYLTGATVRVDGGASLQAHRIRAFPEPPAYAALTEQHRVRLDASQGGGP